MSEQKRLDRPELREKVASEVLKAFYPDGLKGLDGSELILLNMKCFRAADLTLEVAGSHRANLMGMEYERGRRDERIMMLAFCKEAEAAKVWIHPFKGIVELMEGTLKGEDSAK